MTPSSRLADRGASGSFRGPGATSFRPLTAPGFRPLTAPARSTTLVERHDPQVFTPVRRTACVRLAEAEGEAFDAILEHDTARLEPMAGGADPLLTADPRTWPPSRGTFAAG